MECFRNISDSFHIWPTECDQKVEAHYKWENQVIGHSTPLAHHQLFDVTSTYNVYNNTENIINLQVAHTHK